LRCITPAPAICASTTPITEKEEQEYVDSIRDAVQWLGFDWGPNGYFASDYFDYMYEAAEYLISAGHAYVDEQSAEEMRANRGTLTEPGKPGPWRDRPAAESLARFREMREEQTRRRRDGAARENRYRFPQHQFA